MKKITVAGLCLAIFALVGMPIHAKITAGDITGEKKAPHVNVAIFHKLHGQENFQYPKHIKGEDILTTMAGKAQFIAINHTAGLQDGDIIMVSNDVLRDNAGEFEDFGVDCQLSVQIKDTHVVLAGMCEMLLIDQDYREIEHKGVVKPAEMTPGAGWQLIYYDAEDGIAVYADEKIGLE